MPRQIDLFPQNLQVNHNPTNQLGVTAAQINHLNDQIPAAQAAAQALALNSFLESLDKATGLNLVLWSQQLQALFSQTTSDNLLASFQSWLASLTTVQQDITNFISNAISGGTAPTSSNSPASSIYDALLGIPHTNIVIPPSPGSGSVTHDANANATPFHAGLTGLETVTWYHTCGADANYLVVRVGFFTTSATTALAFYDGVAMQLLASQKAADGFTNVRIYGLPNPTLGTNPVSVTVWTPFGSYVDIVAAESDSYVGVSTVAGGTADLGQGSSPSITVPSATGDYIVQAFAAGSTAASQSLTGYNQTQQYYSGNLSLSLIGDEMAFIAGDAAGGSSVTFTTTPSCDYWAGAAASLVPLPATQIGSGFRAANTSTGSVSAASGDNVFGASFFNNTVTITADGTYSAVTDNEYTVEHAGWYTVTVSVLLVSTFNSQLLGLSLQQNFAAGGAALKRGHTSFISNPGFSTNYVFAHTFQVYCSAGDSLQPAYYCSTSGSAFTGTADGLSTYFEVSLNNRSLM